MPLSVPKQRRETSQSLIRRFMQKVRQSGVLIEVRKRRFKKKPKSKTLQKVSALRRIKKTQEYEQLNKMGKQ